MDLFTEYILPCIYAFFSCAAFSVFFNLRVKWMPLTCLGGSLGWLVYLLLGWQSDVYAYFVATIVIALYSEVMARVCRVPVTLFLTTGILPLVPGAGMYYTMKYCASGDMAMFMETGVHTLALAGAIALGIVLVTSLVRMWKVLQSPKMFYKEEIRREDY